MKSLQSLELSSPPELETVELGRVTIHETAIIDPSAELGRDVQIGPYSVIGKDTVIGDGTVIGPYVAIEPWTIIGKDCRVFAGAKLGGVPQDQKFKGERSYLRIGDRNIIREDVTIHRATGEGNATTLGDDNMLMVDCHIGHNCTLGDGITMANMVGIAGHVTVEDKAVFGGIVGVHQFVRIGKLAMLGGHSKVTQDVLPFMMVDGRPVKVIDLNVRGLRRNGVAANVRSGLRQAYKLLYRSSLNQSQAIEVIENEVEQSPERDYLLDFIRNIRFGCSGHQNEPQ